MVLKNDAFVSRRRRFMEAIGPGTAAIFPATAEQIRSNDVEYRYRQQSDFHYLTGFPEPEAVALLLPGHPSEEYVLFVRPRDPSQERWTGPRVGVDRARSSFGAAAAYPIEQLDEVIPRYLADRERLYYMIDRDERFNQRVLHWLQAEQGNRLRTGSGVSTLLDAGEIVHEMRLHKSPEELERIRQAIAITADAHQAAMREVHPGRYEYEIEALLEYRFRRAGASGPAYPSIVASGANATVLHYTRNDSVMARDDMVLIDAGAEYEFYCADVTRTFPVGRRFDGRQRAVYEIVLGAQLAAIETVRPGVRFEEVHKRAVKVLSEGLVEIGLLNDSPAEIIEKELYRPFFMHRTSHWLGLDVHDVGGYRAGGESRRLEPGMVLTVEPGIYLSEDDEHVGAEWQGLAVRIEDDVLVTPDGYEVLSAAIPKHVDDVEALRREAQLK